MSDDDMPDDLASEAGLAAEPGVQLAGIDPPGLPDGGEEGPEPAYLAVEDWVLDHFLPTFRRSLGGEFRWCAQWWRHVEAVSRLTALWHAWEVLRLQPGTGIAIWYRDHLDHQLPILMGARGPFCQCTEAAHREPRTAIAVPAPEDWWDVGVDDLGAARLPGLTDTSAQDRSQP
jgi:hypothetical protein